MLEPYCTPAYPFRCGARLFSVMCSFAPTQLCFYLTLLTALLHQMIITRTPESCSPVSITHTVESCSPVSATNSLDLCPPDRILHSLQEEDESSVSVYFA